jgi:hypothetical protein
VSQYDRDCLRFRCGKGPAVEVTNHLVDNGVSEGTLQVDPKFLQVTHPERAADKAVTVLRKASSGKTYDHELETSVQHQHLHYQVLNEPAEMRVRWRDNEQSYKRAIHMQTTST